MSRHFLCKLLLSCALLLAGVPVLAASAQCVGHFPNPITDICWSCMFPVSLGGKGLMVNAQEDNASTASTACACASGSHVTVGVNIGFWEPVRVAEVVRHPYCFPTLDGVTIDAGIPAPEHAQVRRQDGQSNHSFYQAHWYMAPWVYWLEMILDDACLENQTFDLAYLTEIDPTWADSELTFILNPDAILFSNPAAKAVCAADCVAASAGFPISQLYWCAGCQGSLFPFEGFVDAHIGGVQAATLIAERLTAKLHRELLMWAAAGDAGSCGYYPQVLMDKGNYKMQMLYPIPNTTKIAGRCCQPYGRSTIVTGAGKEYPYKGEDFTFQIFRKRNCCQGYSL